VRHDVNRTLTIARPTVAIALGGDGARGIALALALQPLEEMRIRPIAIAGTSITQAGSRRRQFERTFCAYCTTGRMLSASCCQFVSAPAGSMAIPGLLGVVESGNAILIEGRPQSSVVRSLD
jgi:hypothetical protein